jgi:hypothetical protein
MAAPTDINLIQQCAIKGFFEQEMVMVLFWSYCVFGIPCILAWSLIGLGGQISAPKTCGKKRFGDEEPKKFCCEFLGWKH